MTSTPSNVSFDRQWALPMSCRFRMFCYATLGIVNQATQDVLSLRVGSLCAPVSCLGVCSFVISNDYCTLPSAGHGLKVLHVPLTIGTCFLSFVFRPQGDRFNFVASRWFAHNGFDFINGY